MCISRVHFEGSFSLAAKKQKRLGLFISNQMRSGWGGPRAQEAQIVFSLSFMQNKQTTVESNWVKMFTHVTDPLF